MKVLIIEDEMHNAKRLQKILEEIDSSIEILRVLDGVTESVNWFKSNLHPDLIFMDVRLTDGLCFDIFSQVELNCPIIFTSAFDQYALRAFKVNSVDYLLKPINKKELTQSLEKFRTNLNAPFLTSTLKDISAILNKQQKSYRTRFLLPIKDSYHTVLVDDISFFFIEFNLVKAVFADGKTCVIPFKMEELEDQLDPDIFFRANRQYLIHSKSIVKISNSFNGKLSVTTRPETSDKLIVSRDKSRAFKDWLDR